MKKTILAGAGALALTLGGAVAASATVVDPHPTYGADCGGFTVTATVDTHVQWFEHENALTGEVTEYGTLDLAAGESHTYPMPESAGQYNWWSGAFSMGSKHLAVNSYPVECPDLGQPDPGPQPETEFRWVEGIPVLDCEANTTTIPLHEEAAGYYLGDDGEWHLGKFFATGNTDSEVRDATVEECPVIEEPEEPGSGGTVPPAPEVPEAPEEIESPTTEAVEPRVERKVAAGPVAPERIETGVSGETLAHTGGVKAPALWMGGTLLLAGSALLAERLWGRKRRDTIGA